jgi:tripartite-type tricarboxylate transporter receptor subunit TctC
MRFVAQAKPDGYTLLFGTGTGLAINPSLKKDVPFDPVKDFEPISLVYSAPLFLVTRKDLPVNSVADLIALAKSQPGKLNYASGGSGSSSHLAAELLKVQAGIDMTHVPYPGTAPAIRDVIGGHVDLMFIASGVQYAGTGQVKLLGVTGLQRSAAAPDLPTLAEAGVPGYSATAWFGFLAPAGTPNAVVGRLAELMKGSIDSGSLAARLKNSAAEMELAGSTPAEFGTFIRKEIDKWREVISAARIEPN